MRAGRRGRRILIGTGVVGAVLLVLASIGRPPPVDVRTASDPAAPLAGSTVAPQRAAGSEPVALDASSVPGTIGDSLEPVSEVPTLPADPVPPDPAATPSTPSIGATIAPGDVASTSPPTVPTSTVPTPTATTSTSPPPTSPPPTSSLPGLTTFADGAWNGYSFLVPPVLGRDGGLWFADGNRIVRFDLHSHARRTFGGAFWQARGIASGADGRLWFTAETAAGAALLCLDPATALITEAVRTYASDVVADARGGVWFLELQAGRSSVVRLDAATGLRRVVEVPSASYLSRLILAGTDTLWLADAASFRRIDISTFEVTTAPNELEMSWMGAAVSADGSLWLVSSDNEIVARFDPSTGRTAVVFDHVTGAENYDALVLAPDGRLWTTSRPGLRWLDPRDGTTSTVSLGVRPMRGLTLIDGALWFGYQTLDDQGVVVEGDGGVGRYDPSTP